MKQPTPPPSYAALVRSLGTGYIELVLAMKQEPLAGAVARAVDGGWNYTDCRYRTPDGFTHDQFWAAVKTARLHGDRYPAPVLDVAGRPFTYALPPAAQRLLHFIDANLGGGIETVFPQLDTKANRDRYLMTSLTDEAIASSQIEGAAVTRKIAREMIRDRRKPRTKDERMILNNYATVQMLRDRRSEPMTPEFLCEIQSRMTDGTLDDETGAGRFRRADEDIRVWDDEAGEAIHTPPPAETLPDRIGALCDFANRRDDPAAAGPFVHPAVRAVVLHYWIGHDHPFVDGNGRTARALFYWCMLRNGYWLVEYLTISAVIKTQVKQYVRAYRNTETDDNDLTYFLLYHLTVIHRSWLSVREYLTRKAKEQDALAAQLAGVPFNVRQTGVLQVALKNPLSRFTIAAHQSQFGVAYGTARADLYGLRDAGLMLVTRTGNRFDFTPAPNLADKLRALAATGT